MTVATANDQGWAGEYEDENLGEYPLLCGLNSSGCCLACGICAPCLAEAGVGAGCEHADEQVCRICLQCMGCADENPPR